MSLTIFSAFQRSTKRWGILIEEAQGREFHACEDYGLENTREDAREFALEMSARVAEKAGVSFDIIGPGQRGKS